MQNPDLSIRYVFDHVPLDWCVKNSTVQQFRSTHLIASRRPGRRGGSCLLVKYWTFSKGRLSRLDSGADVKIDPQGVVGGKNLET